MVQEEEKKPAIVAMKGHPCTGKSRVARTLARFFSGPVIDQDDILPCLANPDQSSSMTLLPEELDMISLEVACRTALTQILLRFRVVIDFPLSRRAHVDRLLQLSASAGAPLVIVECKPKDMYERQSWLEQRQAGEYSYKPSTWPELQRELKRCAGESDYEIGDVSRLVVDTTSNLEDYHLHFAVEEVINFEGGILHEELPDWIPSLLMAEDYKGETKARPEVQEEEQIYTKLLFFQFSYNWRDDDKNVNCAKCHQPISGSIYNCNQFDLLLHKKCAESPQNLKIQHQDFPPYIIQNEDEEQLKLYAFPEQARCSRCIEENKDFSYDCDSCLFQTHLRCGLLPTVVRHAGHEHPLLLRMSPVSDTSDYNKFRCDACGGTGSQVFYFCNSCRFKCHVKCPFLPDTIKNRHHRHILTRNYPPLDVYGTEETCDACETTRNSKFWIYSCMDDKNDCEFASHLNCETYADSKVVIL